MNNPPIVLVTPQNEIIGIIDKITAHKYAMLHRAFSVFIYRFNNEVIEILLQQRQATKYHCGGLWTNTCCSHPLATENITQAGERRLFEELGIKSKLHQIGQFHYVAFLDNNFYENELDFVLIGELDKNLHIDFNKDEVSAIKWATISEINILLEERPTQFTPWFKPAFNLFCNSDLIRYSL